MLGEVVVALDDVVVVHDLDRVGDEDGLRALHPHRPGQLLFAHASAWVDPFPYAPDVTTLLYQHLVAPWEGGAPVVGPDGTPTRSEPDDAPEEELARRILEAEPPDQDGAGVRPVDDLMAIAHALGDAAAWRQRDGRRVHFRKGGPVPSAFFT